MKSSAETAGAQPSSPGSPRLTSRLLEGSLEFILQSSARSGELGSVVLAAAPSESKLPCEVTSPEWKGRPRPSLSLSCLVRIR
ncbi:hypothetical protein VZT92_013620 [Zoarces viviparus]|uniref:Uncharacterized protein n=1 Tax=Zoarces viviparus TaxID=48416 RepID=A0AAW1F597_ZOAVI